MSILDSLARLFQRKPGRQQPAMMLWPEWRTGRPEWSSVDLESYLREGFELNSLIYAAIMYKIRSAMSAPMRAYTGTADNPTLAAADTPLAQLIARPNDFQSEVMLKSSVICSLNVAGEAFVQIGFDRGAPRTLYVLRPDWVKVVPGENSKLLGYLYTPNSGTGVSEDGTAILPQEMIHIKFPNPRDPLGGMGHGLSPFAALARSADVDNMVTDFLKLFFDSGTMMGVIIKYDLPMTDDQVSDVKRRWKEMYGGYSRWIEPGVLDQGGDVKRLGMTFNEMGFEQIDIRNEARILGPLGVPGILIGSRAGIQNNSYGTANKEARRQFWEDTMVPELQFIEQGLNQQLATAETFLRYDLTGVPALQRNKQELIASAKTMWDMGTPADQAFSTVGLNVAPLPNGKTSFLPLGVAPAGSTAEAENVQAGKAARWMERKAALSEAQKAQHWKAFDRSARKWERPFKKEAQAQFQREAREILALVSEAKRSALESKATVNYDALTRRIKAQLEQSGDEWRKAFIPLTSEMLLDQAKRLNTQFGMSFDVRNLYSEAWLQEHALENADLMQGVSEDDLAGILNQAQADGWGTEQIAKAIQEQYAQYDDLRAETIARTETIRASNAGAQEQYAAWGAKKKEWISTMDSRVRDNHKAANGEVVGIDEPFTATGESLMYPGDPSGSADNIINCRCTEAPVIE